MRPAVLYYNCDAPHIILKEGLIKPSSVYRAGGVSMSSWSELGSHGPFKIAFKWAPWFELFKPCEYGPDKKNPMFATEEEWCAPKEIRFQLSDVKYVMFMQNAPCVIGPRKLKAIQQELQALYHRFYRVGTVNDPYLSRE